jgi:hypothetical protein
VDSTEGIGTCGCYYEAGESLRKRQREREGENIIIEGLGIKRRGSQQRRGYRYKEQEGGKKEERILKKRSDRGHAPSYPD